jgi:alpha-1,6-mannosyltransferase
MGLSYRAADHADLVRAILTLPGSFAARSTGRLARAMDDHFAALFTIYQKLTSGELSSAA